MAEVIMYTTATCPFCQRAKGLLHQKGVSFTEIRIDESEEKRLEMEEKSGRRSVPQIFINGKHIGGSEELYALERAGKLDPLLT